MPPSSGQAWTPGSNGPGRPRRRAAPPPGTAPPATVFGGADAQRAQLAEGLAQPAETRRQLGLEQPGDLVADVVEPRDPERHGHPALACRTRSSPAEAWSHGRSRTAAPGPPSRTTRCTISLTSRCGSTCCRDAVQLVPAVETRDEVAQIGVARHTCSLPETGGRPRLRPGPGATSDRRSCAARR